MSAVSVALRVAARDALRHPGRAALVAALIALPIVGLAGGVVVWQSSQPTPTEKANVELGSAQAAIMVASTQAIVQDPSQLWAFRPADQSGNGDGAGIPLGYKPLPVLTALLPSTKFVAIDGGYTQVALKTAAGAAQFNAITGLVWDPSLEGRYHLVAGRGATAHGEIDVTPNALAHLGKQLGDPVAMVGTDTTLTIVGVVSDAKQPRGYEALYGSLGTFASGGDSTTLTWYDANTPLSWSDIQRLNAKGFDVLSREVLLNPPLDPAYTYDAGPSPWITMLVAIGGFALFEVLLLAGAALLVGAKRQQRTLAMVASNGAQRGTLVLTVISGGLVSGVVGGAAGAAVGVAGAALFMPWSADGSSTQYYGFHIPWLLLVGIALFAAVIGCLAALVPAWQGSRLDVVRALRGARRPTAKRRSRIATLALGGAIVLIGIATAVFGGVLQRDGDYRYVQGNAPDSQLYNYAVVFILIGGGLALVGLMLLSSRILIALERALGGLGLSAKLAFRDVSRNLGRSVPAVVATMAATFVAVFVMGLTATQTASDAAIWQQSIPAGEVQVTPTTTDAQGNLVEPRPATLTALTAALKAALPTSAVRTLTGVLSPADMWNAPGQLAPVLVVPSANECPRFVEYDKLQIDAQRPGSGIDLSSIGQPQMLATDADWRCRSSFVGTFYGIQSPQIVAGDAADYALMTGQALPATAAQVLAGGGAVALYPSYVADGKTTIQWDRMPADSSNGAQPTPAGSVTLDAVVAAPPHSVDFGILVTPATAARLRLPTQTTMLLASLTRPATQQQLDVANAEILAIAPQAWVRVQDGPPEPDQLFLWVAAALSALIALGSAAVAIGLARSESAGDDAALAAVGASLRTRRAIGFWQGVVLTFVGAVIGAAAGLLTTYVFSLPGGSKVFAAPWLQLGLLTLALPLLIGAGAWLFTGRLRVQQRAVLG